MRGFLSRIDPPEHGRLRELAARTVTWRVFADLEPRIATLTGEPPDAARERGRMELVEDPAHPLPMIVIAPCSPRSPRPRCSPILRRGVDQRSRPRP